MSLLSKPEAGISNFRHSILKSSSVMAMTSATVRRGRVVVAILIEKCAQKHRINATNHNLYRLAMMTRTKHYCDGAKNRKLATINSYLNASCKPK